MARMPRVHIEGALFYVTSRGDNNEDIFKDGDDYKAYLELLRKYKAQFGFKLFAYILMTNHLHLLIELKEGLKLSDIMHDLSSNYTKYFNAKYRRKGHLFQERYKMVIVEKGPYMLKVAAYIHFNPSILHLAANHKDYEHSSYVLFDAPRTTGPAMAEEIRELTIRNYKVFMASIPKGEMERFGKELGRAAILGSADFYAKVEKQAVETQQAEGARSAGPEYRKLIRIAVVGVVILSAFTLYLYGRAAILRKRYKEEMAKKSVELQNRIVEERKKVVQDMQEKYAADKVSYDAMAIRLELEKKKAKELEEKIKK